MRRLWTLPELCTAVGVDALPGPDIHGISIDSRRIEAGELFVALPGDPGPRFKATARSARDGHDFAADAVLNGASAVLVHRPGDYDAPALVVDDTLDALWDIGRASRKRLGGPVIAVTGSSGKTTFKTFAATVLGGFATPGSLNNHIGVPLSLALTPDDASVAVFEIGTNHSGEIEPLARLVKPDLAVLLNVHPAHIENFGTLEAIRREKVSIAGGLGRQGVFVCPEEFAADHPGRTVTFGRAKSADVRLVGVEDGFATLDAPGGRVRSPVPGGGPHRGMSVCALGAVLTALEIPLERLDRLREMEVPQGRGSRMEVAGITIIDESYNANPASMAATLDAFRRESGRRIAILGDMRELGSDSERYHAALAPVCSELDGVLCVGRAVRSLYRALPHNLRLGLADEVDGAFTARCAALLDVGDRVLIKGSNTIFWSKGFVAELAGALERRGR